MDRNSIKNPLLFLIFFIFLVNLAAMKFFWYSAIWWFDMLMHFLGGFWVALLFVFLFPQEKISFKSFIKILGAVLLIGVLWEIFEVSLNSVTVKDHFDVVDTTSDLLLDLLGGTGAALYLYAKSAKS